MSTEGVRLVDRLQEHQYCPLRHLVFEGRDAQRALDPSAGMPPAPVAQRLT